jgi:hypothetical protein
MLSRKTQTATAIMSTLLLSAGTAISVPAHAGSKQAEHLSGQDSPQVVKLRKLTATYPKDQALRLQLAEALAKCNLHEQAIENFRDAYWLEPKSLYGRKAASALQAYGETLKDQAEIEAAQLKAASVRQMVEQIRKQTEADKARIIREGNQVAATPLRSRNSRFRFPSFYDFFGGYYYNTRSSTANSKRQMAAKRALALEESAANLESQLLDPPMDGVRLNATGTNLYVRNYEHTPRAVAQIPEIIPLLGVAKKWNPPAQLKKGKVK